MKVQFVPTRSSCWSGPASIGVSATYQEIDEKCESLTSDSLQRTNEGSKRYDAIRVLLDVFLSASYPNWDGYDARPVNPRSFYWARSFLFSLPLHVPMPDICADPDGAISFEWYRDSQHVFALSIDERGIMHYAGLFGLKSTRGNDKFAGELPEEISRQLRRHLDDRD